MTTRRTSERAVVLLAELDAFPVSQALWPAGPSSDVALATAVRRAVREALTEKQRAVVEAYFFEGLSQGEIARRLGITQQVVQKRLFGARRDDKIVGGALAKLRAALTPIAT
ncbi:MAG: sigma-70 family RNA polymerase sigma factor [Polyangiaceae bacterium]